MALQLYGFRDKTQLLELMVRAGSIEQARNKLQAYLDQLNAHPITDIQVKNQIGWGGLRASGFAANGIINGSTHAPGEEVLPVEGFLGLLNPGAPFSGSATAFQAAEDQGPVSSNWIAWVQFDDYSYTQEQIIVQKSNSYSVSILDNKIRLTIHGALSTKAGTSDAINFTNGEGIWIRAFYEEDTPIALFYTSDAPKTTFIGSIDWGSSHGFQLMENVGTINIQNDNVIIGEFDAAGSPGGFVGRVVEIPGENVESGTEHINFYPQQDAKFGETSWDSPAGTDELAWTLTDQASLQFLIED